MGALPKCFDKENFDVRVIIPKYLCMKEEYKNQLQYVTHFLYGHWLPSGICGNYAAGFMKEFSITLLIMNTIFPVISHMGTFVLTLRSLPFLKGGSVYLTGH